jgi:hypothetical protein
MAMYQYIPFVPLTVINAYYDVWSDSGRVSLGLWEFVVS